jgi:hypothetical protein
MIDESAARIAALESEVERLRDELARYRPPPVVAKPASNPYPDGHVSITTVRTPIALPADNDLRRLMTIVTNRFPQLKPKVDTRWAEQQETEHFASFRAAFFWLSFVIRGDGIDRKRDAEYWMAMGEQWLRAQQFNPRNLQINSFTAAVVAQGDILFAPLDRFPYGLAFALTGFTAPQCLPGCWRAILESNQAPLPIADR